MKVKPLREGFGAEISPSNGESLFDLDREKVIDLFKESGAVLFKGFGVDLEEFNRFAQGYSAEYMTYRGGGYIRRRVEDNDDETLLSVSYDHGRDKQETWGLPLHGEMYYVDHRPLALWFYCRIPAESGGETTICDGSQVYAGLSAGTRDLLARKRLKFSRKYTDGQWQKIYQTDDIREAVKFCEGNGLNVSVDRETMTLRTVYLQPAVITSRWGGRDVYINNILPVIWQERQIGRGDTSIVRFDDDSEIPDEMIDEVLEVQQKYIVPIPWDAGDCVFLDNTRTLHGRREFQDVRRDIYLRMVSETAFD